MDKKSYMTVKEVQEVIGCGEGLAYKIIRELNAELKAKGYLVITGKVPRAYFEEKVYAGTESK